MTPYCCVVIRAGAILCWALKLWRADLAVPFCYNGDQFNNLMIVKGIIDNALYLHNDFVGAPHGLDMHAYPFAANLDLGIMKLIALCTSDCARVINLYFLLTFPLTAAIAYGVFRRLSISVPLAMAGSLLYCFLPYHMLRGEHHLFIASYFTIPLIVLVVIRLFRTPNDQWGVTSDADRATLHASRTTLRGVGAILSCVLVTSAMPYYPVFACYLLLIAGIALALHRRKFQPLGSALFFVAVIVVALMANLVPTLVAWSGRPGKLAVTRHADEAEWNGMKVAQLLLPISGHRVPILREWKEAYNENSPLVNENDASSLGIIGSAGFLILIGRLLRFHSPPGQ